MADLAVIIVSYNSRKWLRPCITSLDAHADGAELDVVVVDNGSTDGSAELVETEFPHVRLVRAPNRGFAAGNNRGLRVVDAPFVLFINADAAIVDGSLRAFLSHLRARPEIGLAGCRQLAPDGEVFPTIRRFPTAGRLLLEALGSEQLPVRASWLGARELDPEVYEREVDCDWVSGSFMLARREAVLAAGMMDERFFLYCEEPDLCLRIKQAGWSIRHLPTLTVVHHFGRAGFDPRLVSQEAYAYRQYMAKHFTPLRRALGVLALGLGHALRGLLGGREPASRASRRASSRAALRTLLGLDPPPFGAPPARAVSVDGPTWDA